MVEDKAQPSDGNLQLPPNQRTMFNRKERDFLRALCLLSFVGICFSIKWSEMLMGIRPDEASTADSPFFIMVTVIVVALRMKGTKNLVRGVIQIASSTKLLLLCSFGLMTSRANAEHLTADIQSSTLVDPNVWKIRDYVKDAVMITILGGLMATLVGVVRSMINRPQQVPAVVSALSIIPALQKTRTQFPIIPAIPPTAGLVPGNDIDDALARSPSPRRNSSPLSWL